MQRAERFEVRSDEMNRERLRLAHALLIELERIESESSIFLVKPVFNPDARYS